MKKLRLYLIAILAMGVMMSCNKDDDDDRIGDKAAPYEITCDEITLTHPDKGDYREYDYYGEIDPHGDNINIVIQEKSYNSNGSIDYNPIKYTIKIQGLSESVTYSTDNNINTEWNSDKYDISQPILSAEGVSISLVPETNLTFKPTLNIQFEPNNTGKERKVYIDLRQITNDFMADITLTQKSI